MAEYLVIGDPVAHSLSPRIHQLFAEQVGIELTYGSCVVSSGQCAQCIAELKQQGVKGVNITLPIKSEMYALADRIDPEAELVGALSYARLEDGVLIGGNADGAGLVNDLLHQYHIHMQGKRILILGAGGAVRGALGAILQTSPSAVTIANRTVAKAQAVADHFASLGTVAVSHYQDLQGEFDLIINGTSASVHGDVPPVPDELLHCQPFCYDMMYNLHQDTSFVAWAKQQGVECAADGLGMLVEHNAIVFQAWFQKLPDVPSVLAYLQQKDPI